MTDNKDFLGGGEHSELLPKAGNPFDKKAKRAKTNKAPDEAPEPASTDAFAAATGLTPADQSEAPREISPAELLDLFPDEPETIDAPIQEPEDDPVDLTPEDVAAMFGGEISPDVLTAREAAQLDTGSLTPEDLMASLYPKGDEIVSQPTRSLIESDGSILPPLPTGEQPLPERSPDQDEPRDLTPAELAALFAAQPHDSEAAEGETAGEPDDLTPEDVAALFGGEVSPEVLTARQAAAEAVIEPEPAEVFDPLKTTPIQIIDAGEIELEPVEAVARIEVEPEAAEIEPEPETAPEVEIAPEPGEVEAPVEVEPEVAEIEAEAAVEVTPELEIAPEVEIAPEPETAPEVEIMPEPDEVEAPVEMEPEVAEIEAEVTPELEIAPEVEIMPEPEEVEAEPETEPARDLTAAEVARLFGDESPPPAVPVPVVTDVLGSVSDGQTAPPLASEAIEAERATDEDEPRDLTPAELGALFAAQPDEPETEHGETTGEPDDLTPEDVAALFGGEVSPDVLAARQAATEAEIKPEPVEVEPEPAEIEPEPIEVEAPVEVKPEPEPVEIEPEPEIEFKAEIEPEPTEVEAAVEVEPEPEPVEIVPEVETAPEPETVEAEIAVEPEPADQPDKAEEQPGIVGRLMQTVTSLFSRKPAKPEPAEVETETEPVEIEPEPTEIETEPEPALADLDDDELVFDDEVEPEPAEIETTVAVEPEPVEAEAEVAVELEPVEVEAEVAVEPEPVEVEAEPEAEPARDLTAAEVARLFGDESPPPAVPVPVVMDVLGSVSDGQTAPPLASEAIEAERTTSEDEPRDLTPAELGALFAVQPDESETEHGETAGEPDDLTPEDVAALFGGEISPEVLAARQAAAEAEFEPEPAEVEPEPAAVEITPEPEPETTPEVEVTPEPTEIEAEVEIAPEPDEVEAEVEITPAPEEVETEVEIAPEPEPETTPEVEIAPEPEEIEATVEIVPEPEIVPEVETEPEPVEVTAEAETEPDDLDFDDMVFDDEIDDDLEDDTSEEAVETAPAAADLSLAAIALSAADSQPAAGEPEPVEAAPEVEIEPESEPEEIVAEAEAEPEPEATKVIAEAEPEPAVATPEVEGEPELEPAEAALEVEAEPEPAEVIAEVDTAPEPVAEIAPMPILEETTDTLPTFDEEEPTVTDMPESTPDDIPEELTPEELAAMFPDDTGDETPTEPATSDAGAPDEAEAFTPRIPEDPFGEDTVETTPPAEEVPVITPVEEPVVTTTPKAATDTADDAFVPASPFAAADPFATADPFPSTPATTSEPAPAASATAPAAESPAAPAETLTDKAITAATGAAGIEIGTGDSSQLEGPGGRKDDGFASLELKKEKQEMIDLLITDKRVKDLWDYIDQLEADLVFSMSPHTPTRNEDLDKLKFARNFLLSGREQYEDAKNLVSSVQNDLAFLSKIQEWSKTYGSRLLAYELIWGIILTLSGFFVTPLFRDFDAFLVTNLQLQNAWIAAMFGGGGGVLAAIMNLKEHIADKQDFDKQHILWYIVTPTSGAFLGFIIAVMSWSGIILSSNSSELNNALLWIVAWAVGFKQNVVYDLVSKILAVLKTN